MCVKGGTHPKIKPLFTQSHPPAWRRPCQGVPEAPHARGGPALSAAGRPQARAAGHGQDGGVGTRAAGAAGAARGGLRPGWGAQHDTKVLTAGDIQSFIGNAGNTECLSGPSTPYASVALGSTDPKHQRFLLLHHGKARARVAVSSAGWARMVLVLGAPDDTITLNVGP